MPVCRELHGVEYTLDSCQEPHLFVICKQLRKAADLAAPEMFFYILDGSVYQTPTIHAAFSARLVSLPATTFPCRLPQCMTSQQIPVDMNY